MEEKVRKLNEMQQRQITGFSHTKQEAHQGAFDTGAFILVDHEVEIVNDGLNCEG